MGIRRRPLAFEVDAGYGDRVRAGLLVLATDQTIEQEFNYLLGGLGVAFHTARLPSEPIINVQTLRGLQTRLEQTAALLLPGCYLDVMAYACTSGSIVIGQKAVRACIQRSHPGVPVTNPALAAVAALQALGARRIALVTPYGPEVNRLVRGWFRKNGIAIGSFASFQQEDDLIMPRISPASIRRAVLDAGGQADADAAFVSCTSLRLAEQAQALEAELGKPVLSSNIALGWHCMRLAGLGAPLPRFGSLAARGLPDAVDITTAPRRNPDRQPLPPEAFPADAFPPEAAALPGAIA